MRIIAVHLVCMILLVHLGVSFGFGGVIHQETELFRKSISDGRELVVVRSEPVDASKLAALRPKDDAGYKLLAVFKIRLGLTKGVIPNFRKSGK